MAEVIFPEYDVRYIAINDGVDTDEFTPLRNWFNEFYARDTSKKIRAVKQAKAQRGERVNGEVPYGYIIDPENKNHLLPDPETAHVVRQIFAMYIRGDRICEIQDWLRENKVLTVSELRYRRTGSCRHPRPHPNCIYNWPDKTLYDILSRKEYLGHTVTAKKCKVSYKSKKARINPEEKRYFFPNTNEALIDEETFDLAQKRIATKHRPTKCDEIDLFSGLLFCGDCGYKMYLQQGAGTLERKHAYTCGRYRNRIRTGEVCTTHYIRKSVLRELVLGDIQRVLSYVKAHEQQFIADATEYGDVRATGRFGKSAVRWTRPKSVWASWITFSASSMRTMPWGVSATSSSPSWYPAMTTKRLPWWKRSARWKRNSAPSQSAGTMRGLRADRPKVHGRAGAHL